MEASHQFVELLLYLWVGFEKFRGPRYTHILFFEFCLYWVPHIALKVILSLHVSWWLGIWMLQDVQKGNLIGFLARNHVNKSLDSRERLCTVNIWPQTKLAWVIWAPTMRDSLLKISRYEVLWPNTHVGGCKFSTIGCDFLKISLMSP